MRTVATTWLLLASFRGCGKTAEEERADIARMQQADAADAADTIVRLYPVKCAVLAVLAEWNTCTNQALTYEELFACARAVKDRALASQSLLPKQRVSQHACAQTIERTLRAEVAARTHYLTDIVAWLTTCHPALRDRLAHEPFSEIEDDLCPDRPSILKPQDSAEMPSDEDMACAEDLFMCESPYENACPVYLVASRLGVSCVADDYTGDWLLVKPTGLPLVIR